MSLRDLSPSVRFSIVTGSLGIFAFGIAVLAALWLPNKDERLANLSSMATTAGTFVALIALIVAAVGGIFAAKQLRLTKTIARHQFLLQFFEIVQRYNPVHIRLRDGDWATGEKGPESPDEWNEVGRYLGLLSAIHYLIVDGIMDVDTADKCYSHRIVALLNNKAIYQKEMVQERDLNLDLVNLLQLLEQQPVYRFVKSGRKPA